MLKHNLTTMDKQTLWVKQTSLFCSFLDHCFSHRFISDTVLYSTPFPVAPIRFSQLFVNLQRETSGMERFGAIALDLDLLFKLY